jgi:hypothetical protein
MMALALAGPLLIAAPALADTDRVSIRSLNFAGSGCAPQGSLTGRLVDFDQDGFPGSLSLGFSSYVARQGPGVSIVERRRNCNLVLSLNLPRGWQYAIRSVRYHGVASLPRSVSGLQQSTYQYPFASHAATLEATLQGPLMARFQRQDRLQPPEWVWSPCNQATPLNLRTQVLLTGPRSQFASLRAARHSYGLVWRRCTR